MNVMKQTLSRLNGVLTAFREIDEQLPMQMAQCLLVIALNPGITMQNLGLRTGLSQSSCSRNVAALGDWHRLGVPGYGLVDSIEDPTERRRKIMFPTPKGWERVVKIAKAFNPDLDEAELKRVTAKTYLAEAHGR